MGVSKKGNFLFGKVIPTVRDWTSRLIIRVMRLPKKEISFLGKLFPRSGIGQAG
jgi:hypothetical protein